ncbi:MAG: ribosome-associated translation inhibitor RaiA [Phycisphaerales bacterium]|nr:MAG: ribosome-associated translation inhibitor RaiA [Phycisphaerales bacterium]
MRIEVTGKHVELTDAIVEYARAKCEKLTRFYDGLMEIECVLDKAAHNEFTAEIVCDVVKHENFVVNARGPDVYACIDQAEDRMARRLRDFKEKLRDNRR